MGLTTMRSKLKGSIKMTKQITVYFIPAPGMERMSVMERSDKFLGAVIDDILKRAEKTYPKMVFKSAIVKAVEGE